MAKRFQNIVATGRFTQPVTVVYALAMLFLLGYVNLEHWRQLLLLAASTFLMTVMNNRNSLIRVFSRLVSSAFLVLSIMIPSLVESLDGCLVQLLFIITLLLLFSAYQDHHAMGTIFFAFICLGLISLKFIQIAFFLPVVWVMLFTILQAGSLRVFIASLLGLLLPYWFWLAYCLHNGCYFCILDHVAGITQFSAIADGLFELPLLLPLIFIVVLGVAGTTHFIRHSYADNIKTRLFYNVFFVLLLCAVAMITLQPRNSDCALRIAIVCVAPLVAHFFTFTNSWLTNISFYGAIVTALALTILNGWIF